MKDILFFDLEVDSQSHIQDIGAWYNNTHFHDSSVKNFQHFLKSRAPGAYYVCGHNIIDHDIPILKKYQVDEEFSCSPNSPTINWSKTTNWFPKSPITRSLIPNSLCGC
jgi:ATP-dependent DNA helicase RecQ